MVKNCLQTRQEVFFILQTVVDLGILENANNHDKTYYISF